MNRMDEPPKPAATTNRLQAAIAALAGLAIIGHLLLRLAPIEVSVLGVPLPQFPLVLAMLVGGLPLVAALVVKLLRLEFGSDLLAGLSIVTSALLGEWLAGTLVVLMLSGGEALEGYAVRRASSALTALARRMPAVAHSRRGGSVEDVRLSGVAGGALVVGSPHETCTVG